MNDVTPKNKFENEQIIYFNIDDSGKLVDNQQVAIYAGLVFTSKQEKDKFITQYKSIVETIKCKYCNFILKFLLIIQLSVTCIFNYIC